MDYRISEFLLPQNGEKSACEIVLNKHLQKLKSRLPLPFSHSIISIFLPNSRNYHFSHLLSSTPDEENGKCFLSGLATASHLVIHFPVFRFLDHLSPRFSRSLFSLAQFTLIPNVCIYFKFFFLNYKTFLPILMSQRYIF